MDRGYYEGMADSQQSSGSEFEPEEPDEPDDEEEAPAVTGKRKRQDSEEDGDDGEGGPAPKRRRTEPGDEDSDASASQPDLDELIKRFVRGASAWARANDARVRAAYASDGGWEVWLEVELYLWLSEHDPDLGLARQNPYPGQAKRAQRGDLLIGDAITVELKAETARETGEAFAARVASDQGKVDAGQDERPALVVAFACTEEGSAELRTLIVGAPLDAGPVYIHWEATAG
ncbi:hypothetical protein RM780_26310 [Streptomyces sp. DSM 44917]|uniref:Uncharacterized protein n=1 Tax=Streptomyces boetiae TaxID=3075541 RepID=A0ABU2LFR9_9ACTN|nr:hypothetical protein [Streptomyces sp. DSM 44917]MDT0310435.1 hypothetical protein [Streptomyces sp. DSM 44917]